MYVIFDTVHHEEFDSEEKTGNGSSFVGDFYEKPSKTAEIAGKRPAFREFEVPANSGGLGYATARRSDSKYAEYRKLEIGNYQILL